MAHRQQGGQVAQQKASRIKLSQPIQKTRRRNSLRDVHHGWERARTYNCRNILATRKCAGFLPSACGMIGGLTAILLPLLERLQRAMSPYILRSRRVQEVYRLLGPQLQLLWLERSGQACIRLLRSRRFPTLKQEQRLTEIVQPSRSERCLAGGRGLGTRVCASRCQLPKPASHPLPKPLHSTLGSDFAGERKLANALTSQQIRKQCHKRLQLGGEIAGEVSAEQLPAQI